MDSNNGTNTVKLEPGQFLIKERTPCDALYIIKEGQLEVYRTAQGEKIPLGLISSGQYVGETALIGGGMNSSNVQALSPVVALKLPRASIEAQLKSVPPWLVSLTRGLIERLHNLNDLVKRNGLVDENLSTQLKAVGEKYKKAE
ncbi:MAG: Crp/Fnr family transcriptional regulator [Bdellovibrionales bacterium]